MLIRLFAGEIILGKFKEENVPARLKNSVHKYLEDMGYYDIKEDIPTMREV